MEPILWEVLNCVFVGFAANEERLRDKEGTLKALYSMPTYFDKHREQLELYEDVSAHRLVLVYACGYGQRLC
jgi:hypothetical protein